MHKFIVQFGIIIVILSLVGTGLSKFFGSSEIAITLATPGLILLGWSTLGHFVTLDDDMPGEWSNPEGDKSIWYESLAELAAKAVLFVALAWLTIP